MLDLTSKPTRLTITGLQGSGKTVLVKNLLAQNPKFYVYDVMNEYNHYNRYVPTNKDSVSELSLFLKTSVLKKGSRIKGLFIDEANRYIPARKALPKMIRELNDVHRHYNLTWGVVTRRPSQLHTDLFELAHFRIFVGPIHGKNDLKLMDSLKEGLADLAREQKMYHYIVLDQFGNVTQNPPCPLL